MKRKVIQFFVLLSAMTVLLGALHFLHFGGLTGFVIFEDSKIDIPDFYIVSSEKQGKIIVVDYYPGKYIGKMDSLSIEYSIIDEEGEILYSGNEVVSLNVKLKSKFLLEIDVGEGLPDNFEVVLDFLDGDEVLESESFNEEFFREVS